MRPWSETAKSTRSSLRPPSSTRCAERALPTATQAQEATASATSATAAAAIAIHAAASSTWLLRGREQERHGELRGVVRGVLLARDRLDLDLELRLLADLGAVEVAEDDAHA